MVFEPSRSRAPHTNGTTLSISSSEEVTEAQCFIQSEGDLL